MHLVLPYENETSLQGIEASPFMVIFIDLDDRILLANASTRNRFQSSLGDLKGRSLLDLLEPSSHHDYLVAKQELKENDHWTGNSTTVTCLSGPTRMTMIFSCVRDPNGTHRYTRVLFREGQQDAQDASQFVLSAVDEKGIFTRCEGGLANNIVPQVVGRHFTEVFHGMLDAQDRVRRALAGESFDAEVFVRGFWYSIWYAPLRDKSGKPCGAQWTSFPINKQKHNELQLKKAVRDSQQATRLREDLLSMASHDIRGPLGVLALQIQMLEDQLNQDTNNDDDDDLNGEATRLLVTSGKRQVARVVDLVEKTLDASNINEQGLKIERCHCDLSALVRDLVERNAVRTSKDKCRIEISTPQSLWANVDSCRIEQAIENLLSNALKYGRAQPVLVNLETDGTHAILKVTDQGPGISLEDQAKIFERFVRLQGDRNIKGFGIGLYIVKQIADAHGGRVKVVSNPGRGSTFSLEIPLSLGLETYAG